MMLFGPRYTEADLNEETTTVDPSMWSTMHIMDLYKQRQIMLDRKKMLMQLYPSNFQMLNDLQIGIDQLATIINIKENE